MSLSAHRNKTRRTHMAALLAKIHALEQAHKLSLAAIFLKDLIKTREELLEALGKSLKRKYILTQKLFYELGNKSGKLLARALRSKKASHTIRDSSGASFASSRDIATQFIKYFSELYNLPPANGQGVTPDRQSTLRGFLTHHCPSTISSEDSSNLVRPISTEEITEVLKQLKPGKSPGPDGLTVSYYRTFQEILTPQTRKDF